MINFQRIIDDYKESKRKTLQEIEDSIYHMKERCFNGLVFPSYGCFNDRISIIMGMLVIKMEKDLGKTIPLLRKSKEKMQSAKQHFHEKNFSLSRKSLLEAEKCLLQFKEKEFEEILTTALKKNLEKVQL